MAKGKRKTNKNHKQTNPTVSTKMGSIITILLKASFIGLAYLFYMNLSLQWMGIIMIADCVLALLYWFTHNKYITKVASVEKHSRIILSYIITLITVTFYSLAMIRADQMNDTIKLIIIPLSLFVWYAIYISTKDFLFDIMKRRENIEK